LTEEKEGPFRSSSLVLYTLIAYGFSWVFWLPQVLASNGFVPWSFFAYICGFIAPFGPLVAAISVTYLKEGKNATKKLLSRGVKYKFGKKWLILLFALSPLWAGSALLVGFLTENVAISLPWLSNPLSLIANPGIYNFAYLFVFFGIAEEFGWRGFALQKTSSRISAIASALIVGLIWSLWHLPLLFINGSAMQTAGLVPSIAQTMVFSIWFAWFYFNTGGSVLATSIFHSFNALTLFAIFPVAFIYSSSSIPVVYLYGSAAIITATMLIYSGTKTMVRSSG
jgi:CAAX protease family protein